MLVEGMEVMVKSLFISGEGKIRDISNDAFYPVQVELNEVDQDGHKVYRFSHSEVEPLEVEKKEEADQAPETKTVQLVKIIGGYSLKVGECFTAKYKSKTHYWIYSGDRLRGCFPVKYFSMITVADIAHRGKKVKVMSTPIEIPEVPSVIEAITVAALEEAEQREKELQEQAKKKKKKPKTKKLSYRQLEEAGQTNIFDFI